MSAPQPPGVTVFLTGLSGAGKSTIADALVAGLEAEGRPTAAGDYVLTGDQTYGSWNAPVTGTVFVNGHALSTFLGHERHVVITP